MVLPNGASDVSILGLPLILSADANSATSISDLASHDQNTVVDVFKDKYITNGTSVWSNATGPLAEVWNLLLAPLSWLTGFIDNGDGTLSSILDGLFNDNGDGTWSFIDDAIHALLDGGDGTLSSPLSLLQSLLGQLGTFSGVFSQLQSLIDTFFNALHLTNTTGNQPDSIEQALADLLGIFGNPLGLGSGTPTLPTLSDIPILGDLQNAVDHIWNAYDTGIIGTTTDNPVSAVFQAIFGIFGTGSNAQAVNVIQDSRLDALAGGGSGLSDAFDGAASSSLNATNWLQIYSYSGSGTCGLSGDGFCVWNTSGGSVRAAQNVYKTATSTDTQSVAFSLGSNISSATGVNPEVGLQGRVNSTGTDYIVARISYSSVEIGYVLSNAYTRLGAAQSLSTGTSGTWQLKLGTAASSREFVLLHDGATVISRTDSGAASAMNSSHRYTGFDVIAGWSFSIFFGIPQQVAPPPIGAWAASDVTP